MAADLPVPPVTTPSSSRESSAAVAGEMGCPVTGGSGKRGTRTSPWLTAATTWGLRSVPPFATAAVAVASWRGVTEMPWPKAM